MKIPCSEQWLVRYWLSVIAAIHAIDDRCPSSPLKLYWLCACGLHEPWLGSLTNCSLYGRCGVHNTATFAHKWSLMHSACSGFREGRSCLSEGNINYSEQYHCRSVLCFLYINTNKTCRNKLLAYCFSFLQYSVYAEFPKVILALQICSIWWLYSKVHVVITYHWYNSLYMRPISL